MKDTTDPPQHCVCTMGGSGDAAAIFVLVSGFKLTCFFVTVSVP